VSGVDRKGYVEVTDLVLSLFGDDGWDPFIEDPGTLWLLHWRLVRKPNPTSTWHLALTRWRTDRFVRDVLVE
jgi:hypothetical protein